MKKVFLIAGSPMTGKSTAAMALSSELKYAYMSTDDIGEVIQTALNINPMNDLYYLDYYETTDINSLIEDIVQYHLKLKDPINRLIDIHSTWGNPFIMEGWAIYPENIAFYPKEIVSRIWIIAAENLLRTRLQKSASFQNASVRAKENYLSRSLWHNDLILSQCKKYNEPFIMADEFIEKEAFIEAVRLSLL